MPRRRARTTIAERVLQPPDSSVLDLLDHLLDKGVMATGDLTLGVANIDLIYVRLSALLCAADRVLPPDRRRPGRHARQRVLSRRLKPTA